MKTSVREEDPGNDKGGGLEMALFRVRDLTVNIAATPEACDGSTVACFNSASIHPPSRMVVHEAACDEGTVACFNSASIHPPEMMEMIAAVGSDGSPIACFNAGSVYPPDVIRAVVPLSASAQDLAALKAELRSALERLEPSESESPAARAPETLAEVDLLQRAFSEALAELGTQRLAIEQNGS